MPPEEFAANYDALLRRWTHHRALVLGPAPVTESDEPGSRTNRETARYSAIAADVAEHRGATFISLVDVLGPDDLADDGVHLNDHGYDIVERLVVHTIEQRPGASEISTR